MSIKESEKPFNLSELLNILDGIHSRHSQMMVWCCNHPERLDPALIRPGRFDRKLKFGNLHISDIKIIMEKYYEVEMNLKLWPNLSKLENKLKVSDLHAILGRYPNLSDAMNYLIQDVVEDF